MRPLDFLGRIKVKLGIVIVLAVATAFVVNEVGINAGYSRDVRIAVAVVLALIMVQLLARGMTKPLREMASAAQTIAKGRYSLRVRATSRDEVGELARAFNAMAADLGEVDRQRRELIANVSHELRTPITGLRAVLENVVDGVSAPDPVTMGTALAQTERLGRLVAQLLDLSRLDSGARLIEPEPVALGPLVEQAVRESGLARDDVTFACTVSPGLVVHADPDLLAQVLANLLDNAVRHSPASGVVTLAASPAGAGMRLTVSDQGPGIPEAARGRVFERFSRLDAGRAADAGGAGLGLAIVKEIVELHGGSIRIDDCGGCRMVVDLPERTTMEQNPLGAPMDPAPVRTALPAAQPPAPALTAPVSTGPALTATASALTATAPAAPAMPVAAAALGVPVTLGAPALSGALAMPATPAALAVPAEAGQAPAVAASAPTPGAGAASRGTAEVGATRTALDPVDGRDAEAEGALVAVGEGEGLGAVEGRRATPYAVSPTRRLEEGRSGLPPVGAAEEGRSGLPPVEEWRPGPGLGGGGGMPSQGYPPGSNPATGGTGRVALWTLVGLLLGFLFGLVVAFFIGLFLGTSAGIVVMLLSTAAGAAIGASGGTSRTALPPAAAPYSAQGPPPLQGGHPPPYVPPPLFPRPELPDPPRWLLAAVVGVGVFAAVALPFAQAGLGMVLLAIMMGGAAMPALARRMTPWTVAFGLTAYALVSMVAVRDADWLIPPLLLAAFGLAALAVSGAGRGWLGVVRGGASVLISLVPVPWFVGVPLKRLTAERRVMPLVVGGGITALLLAVFGVLFASADAVFAKVVNRLLTTPDWAESLPGRVFVFLVFGTLLASVVLVALRPVADPAGPSFKTGVSRTIWMLPLIGVNLLFAAFVAVQVTVLFGGNALVLRTARLTYADYARQGFFQLVVVSVFVLAIVAVASGVVRAEGRRDRLMLSGLLGLLCALTMVILVSALQRLGLYTDAYGLSRLRASVEAAIWWLGALFVLVIIAGAARLSGRGSGWLPRTVVLVTGLGLLAFALWNPDLRVAETQVTDRSAQSIDLSYVSDLGAEAVPALDRLPEPWRSCVLADVVATNGLDAPDPWNGWNLARQQARELLAERPVLVPRSCPGEETRSID